MLLDAATISLGAVLRSFRCKSKTAASQQHCESCADAEKQAVKQLAEVQRERAEYIAQRDEVGKV